MAQLRLPYPEWTNRLPGYYSAHARYLFKYFMEGWHEQERNDYHISNRSCL